MAQFTRSIVLSLLSLCRCSGAPLSTSSFRTDFYKSPSFRMVATTSAMLLVALTVLSGAVLPCKAQAPSDNQDLLGVLVVSKLQAPTSSDRVDDLVDWSSEWFYDQVRQVESVAGFSLFCAVLGEVTRFCTFQQNFQASLHVHKLNFYYEQLRCADLFVCGGNAVRMQVVRDAF